MDAPESVRRRSPTDNRPGTIQPLPFVGRRQEISKLFELHTRHKNVLILGSAGMGKSALIEQLHQELSLLVSSKSAHLGEICDGLEPQLNLHPGELKLLKRKQVLREALKNSGRTVIFDGLGWTTPKVTSFIQGVAEQAPVWICLRSERPWDVGHIWPFLVRFEKLELHPFHLNETQEFVHACVNAGRIPRESGIIVDWLHRRSGGSPLVLRELFEELATGKYDLSSPHALKRLDLDRRIHEVFPVSGPGVSIGQHKAL